jgi:uncharacterized protein YjbI with pentapeptide repeats
MESDNAVEGSRLTPGKKDYEEETFLSMDFSVLDVCDFCFEDCRFVSCKFRECAMPGAAFRSCSFEGCEFVLTKMDHVTLNGALFSGCKIMGVNFSACDVFGFSPEFSGCIIDSSVFYGNRMRKGRIADCRLVGCDFIECDLKEADFSGSSMERVVFQRCDMERADFRAARGYQIDPASNKLRKARFRLPEAESFLAFLGISIED